MSQSPITVNDDDKNTALNTVLHKLRAPRINLENTNYLVSFIKRGTERFNDLIYFSYYTEFIFNNQLRRTLYFSVHTFLKKIAKSVITRD